MFTLTMLPAAQGDCLWIEYGSAGNIYRVLIDTGPPDTLGVLTTRIEALPEDERRVELFIVSHIDNDHIGGAADFLDWSAGRLEIGDVWFNGYRHLLAKPEPSDQLGVREAQELTKTLLDETFPWNQAFGGRSVMVPSDGRLPTKPLAGGLTITLLSPYHEQLRALQPEWTAALVKLKNRQPDLIDAVAADYLGAKLNVQNLAESPFQQDTSAPNGSSIAVMLEFEGRQAILTADAFPSVIERSVDRLLDQRKEDRLTVEAFKVCHHGSRRNTSNNLAKKLAARRYLYSSDGTKTKHPNLESVARFIHFGERNANFIFNYRTEWNRDWDNGPLKKQHRYTTCYPNDEDGITVDLEHP